MVGYSKTDQIGKSKKKARPGQIKPGKKTMAWDSQRRHLISRFKEVGITTCEIKIGGICMDNFALSFAHEHKRRDIPPGELNRVALACGACHEHIEYKVGRDQMYEIVNSVIESRAPAVNKILLAP